MVKVFLAMGIFSPGLSTFFGTFTPLTLTPLVLPMSLMSQKPSWKDSSQCSPDTLGNRRQMSHPSRRPMVKVLRISGILSPPPSGTNSPLGSKLMGTTFAKELMDKVRHEPERTAARGRGLPFATFHSNARIGSSPAIWLDGLQAGFRY